MRYEDFLKERIFLPAFSPVVLEPLSQYLSSLRGRADTTQNKEIDAQLSVSKQFLKCTVRGNFLETQSSLFMRFLLPVPKHWLCIERAKVWWNPHLEFTHSLIHSFILKLFIEHLKHTGVCIYWIYSSEQNKVFSWSLHPNGWAWTVIRLWINKSQVW